MAPWTRFLIPRRSHKFISSLLLITLLATLVLSSHALPRGPRSSREQSKGESIVRPRSGSSGSTHTGAAEFLRLAMNYMDDDTTQETQIDAGTPIGVLLSHVSTVVRAMFAPFDLLVHLAHEGTHEGHELSHSITAAMKVFGFNIMNVTTKGRSATMKKETNPLQPIVTEPEQQQQSEQITVSGRSLLSDSVPSVFGTVGDDHSDFCSSGGQALNATRTLYTCLTAENRVADSQPFQEYLDYVQGSLLDVFAGEQIALDSSITPDITCDQIWTWWTTQQNNTFWNQAIQNVTAPEEQKSFLFQACQSIIPVGNGTGSPDMNLNTSSSQYCSLFSRCFERENLCHSWVDSYLYCSCPYDRAGSYCENFVEFQCDIKLVYPGMDTQTYVDSSGEEQTYSCPLPSSFQSRLSSNYANAGANSKVIPTPQTDLQKKYGFLGHLDGDAPCLEWPSTLGNPSVIAIDDPTGQQEFRYTLSCAFTPDQDTQGTQTMRQQFDPPTWARVREGPSDEVIAFLIEGNFTWEKDYSKGFTYDVLQHSVYVPGEVMFAISSLANNSIQLNLHVQNFAHLSDNSFDVMSDAATIDVFTDPPTDVLIQQSVSSGNPSLLRSSTLGGFMNLTTLRESYWRGGRYHFDAVIATHWADAPRQTYVVQYPRGLVGAQYPVRFFIERSTYQLEPPRQDHKLSMIVIAVFVLLGIAVIGSAYKYYEYRKAEEFQLLVKRAKHRAQRREAEMEQARLLRIQERARGLQPIDLETKIDDL